MQAFVEFALVLHLWHFTYVRLKTCWICFGITFTYLSFVGWIWQRFLGWQCSH